MTQRARREIDPAAELRLLWALGAAAAAVSVLALVVGTWLGLRLALTKHLDHRDNWEHTNLGVGVAIVLLSVLLAILAAGVSAIAFKFERPRQAKLDAEAKSEARRLAQQTW